MCLAAQGLGAINAVGKAAAHVANSLDNAVETLFEGWNGSAPPAAADLETSASRQVRLCCAHVGSPSSLNEETLQPSRETLLCAIYRDHLLR